jgi:PKD repeat protein
MKPIFQFLAIFALLHIQTGFLNAQGWNIAKRYSASPGGQVSNTAVALAPDGSTFVVGNFRGTVDLETYSITSPVDATHDHGFLLKLNASFQPQWVRTFPQKAYHVTVDAQGNVFIVGSVQGSTGDSLAYVAKYGLDGSPLGSFMASGTAESWAKVGAIDAAGNCYIGGERFSGGALNFGQILMGNVSSRQCFLVKLSSDLSQVLWATYTGESSNLDNIYDVKVDNQGFVYTTGNYSQNYSIGCFCYNGSFFTEKHNAETGASVWKKIFSSGSGSSTKQWLSLSSDEQSVFVSASFKKTTTFQSGISLTAAANDDYHIYLSKMEAVSGNVLWAKKVALTGDNYPTRLARQGAELYLNGYFLSPALMGDTLLTQQGVDAFLVELDGANGVVQRAEKFSGPGGEYGFGLDAKDATMVVSGNTSSNNFTIGDFSLPGSSSSIYVARNGPLAPVAAFTANMTTGCSPITVSFSDQSSNLPTTWEWQFPGGSPATSSEQNPVVVYANAGVYPVSLTTSNAGGSNSITMSQFVLVDPSPDATFTTVQNGLDVSFNNTFDNAGYAWDFGDGQSSNLQNPVHTYADCGTYTVTLTCSNFCGTASSSNTLNLGDVAPTSNFTVVLDGLVATFDNTSSNASYVWDFGDGQTSSEQNPEHTYADCGTYTVTLTSSNMCGTASSTATVTTSVTATAMFTTLIDGLQVSFSNTSTGGASFFWDFGDGDTSMIQHPLPHLYTEPGTYVITLVVTNNCGATIFQQTVNILPLDTDTPVWLEQFRLFPNPNTGIFAVELKGNWLGEIDFTIFKPDGKLIHAETIKPSTESFTHVIDLGNVPPGIYGFKIHSHGESWGQKIVVVR